MMLAMMLAMTLDVMLDMKKYHRNRHPAVHHDMCTVAVPVSNDPVQCELDVVSTLCTIRSKRGPQQISLHNISGVNCSATADSFYD